jgi:hypothetical protein
MKPPTESRGVVAREDAKSVDLCGEIFRPRRGSARPNRSPSPRRDGRGRGADAGVRQGPSRASRTSAFGQVRSARQQRAAGGARRGFGEYPDLKDFCYIAKLKVRAIWNVQCIQYVVIKQLRHTIGAAPTRPDAAPCLASNANQPDTSQQKAFWAKDLADMNGYPDIGLA